MFLEKFIRQLKQLPGGYQHKVFLLAVSGGVDSVVLVDLFQEAGCQFAIAHCNFQLRNEESERDEAFVKNLEEKYGKEVLVKRFDTAAFAIGEKVSTQVAARNLRYDWFTKIAIKEKKADYIVTAHHADDNIETVVMNFFRGTGLQGLTGMDTIHNGIYRPLLHFRKKEILAYAMEKQLSFVEDSSNESSKYTRNYFRNELLPAIEKVFPETEENILRNIGRLQEVFSIYAEAMETQIKNLVEIKGKEQHIPILKLQKLKSSRSVLWEIIKEKGFTAGQLQEVIKLMDAANGSHISSASHRIIKNRKWLIIAPKEMAEGSIHYIIDEAEKEILFEGSKLKIVRKAISTDKLPIENSIAFLDARQVSFPLIVRKAKQGDYFYPLGMQKKKKLNRFFIDQKLSKTEKENAWVVESDKRICWVVGYRIDNRFKVSEATKEVVKLLVG